MPKKKNHRYNRERLLLTVLIALSFFGFLLWSIKQTSSEETTLLIGYENINFPARNKVIKISSPKVNTAIKSPVKISGQASVFEAVLRVRMKDASGLILAQQQIMTAEGQKMSSFNASIKYKKPTRSKGIIEIFSNSPKDGSEINKLTIPVIFKD